jgi:hypothetical protein
VSILSACFQGFEASREYWLISMTFFSLISSGGAQRRYSPPV